MTELAPLLTWALVLGAAGTLHCVGMCGPLTLAVSRMGVQRTKRVPRGQLTHHIGRITTYLLLGFTAGSLGRGFTIAGWQQAISIALGLALIASVLLPQATGLSRTIKTWIGRQVRHLIPANGNTQPLSRLGLGMAHGLLPCGLVYVALAGAASAGDPIRGAMTMAAFGFATLPGTFGLSWIAHLGLQNRFPNGSRWLLPGLAVLTGILLIVRGSGLGIPYLSPNLQPTNEPTCCTATTSSGSHPLSTDIGPSPGSSKGFP